MRGWPTSALAALLALAGCLSPDPVEETAAPPVAPALSAVLPAMEKATFATDPALPLPDLLAQPTVTTRTITIAAGMRTVQVAIDLDPSLPGAAAAEQAHARLLDPSGEPAHQTPPTTGPAKTIVWLAEPAAGDYTLEVTAKGSWAVGYVVVGLPLDFTPGLWVNVSFPEQREVDHSFSPNIVFAAPGAPTRITTFDYDPHPGVENLQHNVYLPAVGAKSDGKTTWGEIRTLDFVAPATPGKYDFYCEFHEDALRGTLVVE